MNTTNISYREGVGKGGRYVVTTTLPPLCVYCLELWAPPVPETHRACQGSTGIDLHFFASVHLHSIHLRYEGPV